MKTNEIKCCTPNGQIKRYKDCIGCDRNPLELNQNKMTTQDLPVLKDYYDRMKKYAFADSKEHLLDMLDWLIAYYENRAACTPKEYLESLINSKNLDGDIFNSERIRLLYNWVNYKRIVGF